MASTLFDSNNSSTVNLTSGGTFTGTNTLSLGIFSIVTMLECDQTCTVYIDQSGNNINFDVTDTFYYVPGKPFGIVTQAIGKAYRVRVTNNGAVTTTTFRLTSFRQDSSNTLPRALDTFGNLKMSINGLYDQFGFTGQFCPRRQLSVEEPSHLAGTSFGSTTDTNFWTVANSGAGSGADAGTTTAGVATLTSGTANSGYGQINSVRTAHFYTGSPDRFLSFCRLTETAVANNSRVWGAMTTSAAHTPTDGYYFSVSGTGVLSVNVSKGGSVTTVSSGSFNGNISQFILDTNVHAYEIIYGSFGAYFIIDGILVHNASNTSAAPALTNTLQLQIFAWSANSASGTASAVLQISGSSIYRLGKATSASASAYINATVVAQVLKIGPGRVHRVVFGAQPNATTVTLWDNTTNSGTTLWSSGALGKGAISPLSLDFENMPFFTGLTVSASGTNPFTVVYE